MSENPEDNRLVCVGKILTAHGVRGKVKLQSYTEDPFSITEFDVLYDSRGRVLPFSFSDGFKNNVTIASIKDIADRDEALKLNGVKIFVNRSQLPDSSDGEYYHVDLIDLEVRLADGNIFGKVTAINNFGAGDIVEIMFRESKKTEMYLFNDDIIPEINIEGGYLVINPPVEITVQEGRE